MYRVVIVFYSGEMLAGSERIVEMAALLLCCWDEQIPEGIILISALIITIIIMITVIRIAIILGEQYKPHKKDTFLLTTLPSPLAESQGNNYNCFFIFLHFRITPSTSGWLSILLS